MLWIRKIHKWLSVIVGIQFLLWLVSGLYFNTMDHDTAAGNSYRVYQQVEHKVDNAKLIEPKEILAKHNPAVLIRLTDVLGTPYYILTHKAGMYRHFENHYSLVNAYTGQLFDVDEKTAITIASNSYSGDHDVIKASLLLPSYEANAEQPLILTRGPSDDLPKEKNALWRIDFDNEINTSVYVEFGSGRLAGHSDDNKRFADIFFMLHFMDYGNHGKFNSLQMMLFAFFTLFVALTGTIWTIDLALKGDYQLTLFTKKKRVTLFAQNEQPIDIFRLTLKESLFNALIEHNVHLPSNCGGVGNCGKCKILTSPEVSKTPADIKFLNVDQLAQGQRLSCQHCVSEVENITLIRTS